MARFGMLFCRMQLQPWYERLKWVPVAAPVWIDQPQGVRQSPLPVMLKCFGTESWPPGRGMARILALVTASDLRFLTR
jgi:hypothetical protein